MAKWLGWLDASDYGDMHMTPNHPSIQPSIHPTIQPSSHLTIQPFSCILLPMFRPTFSRVPRVEWLLLGFLLFSVLWRGGKSLEATWMLVAVAAILTTADAIRGSKKIDPPSLLRSFGGARNGELTPLRPLRRTSEGQGMENYFLSLWVLVFGFLSWTTLSYFFSTTGNYGLDEVLRDGALVLIFLWTMRHAGGESGAGFLHRFIHTMTIAALLGTFFGLLVYVMQPVNRFVGTFFDYRFHTDYWPNAWAQFVLLTWPVIVLWMQGKSGKLRFAGCGLLGIVLGTLLLSYSRGAMIAFGGQILLLGFLVGVNSRRNIGQELKMDPSAKLRGKWKIIAAKIVVVFVTAIALFFTANAVRGEFHAVQSVGEKITFTGDEGGSSIDEREQFWKQSIVLISERPLFGWGPYSFRFVQQRFQTGVLQTSDHPHNVFLKLAVERGIPAAIFFIVFLLCALLPVVKLQIADCRAATLQSAICNRMFLLVALLGVLAHNLIDFNLQFVGIALPFWMMFGILAGHGKSLEISQDKFGVLNKKFVHKIDLIIAVILMTVALREGAFLVTSSIGRHAETRGDSSTALAWYDRSTPEWFSRDMHLSRALLATMRGETLRAQEAMDVFLHLNAEDPRGWRLQGDIAREEGDIAAAVDGYGNAYALGKWNDLSITLALAETLIENEPLLLIQMKLEMDALLGSFVEAIAHNEHFIALSHNAEDAIALAALLAEEFPDSAPRYEVLAARADFAMRAERAKVKSRPVGYLW
ncbi:MAG: Lipid A core-O-antigen ligase-like enyme [Candidatus Peregrinibacteria bacterium Greene1014_49]|nr:MAG: Lipid A core-O-antigen ligase-like enyme [Candidatus Peregrinibacteria bacterium Greene1014_49]